MKVFVFDLLAYGENLDHLKVGTELPYPLSKRHFKADVAVRTYAEHLDAWEEMDRLGYDGVGFNEHHCSPYGLMNSPNLMASAAAQRTKKLKLLIYGNLLPLHEPLRLAEELAMLDCLSNGRLISGFARGIPREYQVHNVPLAEFTRPLRGSLRDRHPRLDRGRVFLRRQVLVVQGRLDLAAPGAATASRDLDPDRRQQGIDRVRRPAQYPDHAGPGRRRTAGTTSSPIMPSASPAPAIASRPTICRSALNAYVADSKAQAVKEMAPYHLYFNRTLFSHGNFTETALQRQAGYVQPELDRLCAAGEPARRRAAARGFPQHHHGRRRAAGRAPAVGHAARGGRAHHRRGRAAPAPTWCRSASIAAPCPRRCSSSRSAALPATCCRALQAHQVRRVPAAEAVPA